MILKNSALKSADNGNSNELIIRLYNPENETKSSTVKFDRIFKKAELCRIDKTVEKLLENNQQEFCISAVPHKIITVKITF